MGYDVHITRAIDWFENNEARIPLEDWLAYVESDPEMRLDNVAEAKMPDGILRYENAGLAVWTAYSHHGEGDTLIWFDFQSGNIVVKNPDEEILAKMCHVAEALRARVQGDEGEYYPESLVRYKSTGSLPKSKGKPWWKKFLGR
jgi:hypothetical protein